jgi:hypothetical protein
MTDRRSDHADGPALELDPDGPAAGMLREASRPLASNPGAGTWGVLLETPDEGRTDRPVLLQWLAPGASEPPEHVHPTAESFEAVEGTLTVVLDGSPRRLDAGEGTTVPPGVEHTFRNDTDGVVAFRADLPSMRTVLGLYTIWGLDHEGAFGPDGAYGEPGPLYGLLLSEDLHGETTSVVVPFPVQRLLWATVGRLLRALGYSGVDDRFLRDEFWERHVEQPRL